MSKTDARGLYRKFYVERSDGSGALGQKHDGCTYFVLDMDCDPHALPALAAYAKSCRETHPQLARDLLAIVDGNALMKQKANL